MRKIYISLSLIICMICSGCKPVKYISDYIVNHKPTEQQAVTQETDVSNKKVDAIRIALCNASTFCPYTEESEITRQALEAVYEPLFSYDENLKIVPVLAESYSILQGGREVRVKLKSNVKWHDGSSLRAGDVISTVNMLLSTDSIYSNQIIEKARIIDSSTVSFIFNRSVVNGPEQLMFPIVNPKKTSELIGTGPFKLTEKKSTDTLSFKVNEDYHGQKPQIEELIMINCPNEAAVMRMFEIGEINTLLPSAYDYEAYMISSKNKVYEYTTNKFVYLAINFDNSVFWGAGTRKALMYAIDKDEIVNTVMNKKAKSSSLPVNPSSYLYNKEFDCKKNTELAAELMLEDSWTRVDGVFARMLDGKLQKCRIKLLALHDEEMMDIADKIKQMLENFGIECIVESQPENIFIQKAQVKDYDVLLGEMELLGASDFEKLTGEGNTFGYLNSSLEQVVKEIKIQKDEAKLLELYNKCYEIFLTDVKFIPLFFRNDAIVANSIYSDNLRAVEKNPFFNVSEWS